MTWSASICLFHNLSTNNVTWSNQPMMRQIIVRCTCFPAGNYHRTKLSGQVAPAGWEYGLSWLFPLWVYEGKGEASSQIPERGDVVLDQIDWEIRNTGCLYAVYLLLYISGTIASRFPSKTNVWPLDTWPIYSRLRWRLFHLWCCPVMLRAFRFLFISYHEMQLWMFRYLTEVWKNIFWSLPRIYFISAKCFPPYRISCVTLFLNMVTPCSEMYEPVADHFPGNDCRIILIYSNITTGRSAMCYLQWSKTI